MTDAPSRALNERFVRRTRGLDAIADLFQRQSPQRSRSAARGHGPEDTLQQHSEPLTDLNAAKVNSRLLRICTALDVGRFPADALVELIEERGPDRHAAP